MCQVQGFWPHPGQLDRGSLDQVIKHDDGEAPSGSGKIFLGQCRLSGHQGGSPSRTSQTVLGSDGMTVGIRRCEAPPSDLPVGD